MSVLGRRVAAVVFSLWSPGLGQLYNAQPKKALLFFCMSWFVGGLFLLGITTSTFSGLLVTLILGFAVLSLACFDAIRFAGDQRLERPFYSRGWAILGVGLTLSLVASVVIYPNFRVRSFYIPGGSMEPTLQVGDRLIADVSLPSQSEFHRGDLVLFLSTDGSSSILIKRVIGLPGETVEIREKVVLVGGLEVNDWAVHRDSATGSRPGRAIYQRDNFGPIVLPSDHVFMMGDNRDFSFDSRYYGPVPLTNVVGRPLYLYWSISRDRIGLRF